MRIFRRRILQGLIAFLLGFVSVGVRTALIGANSDPTMLPIATPVRVQSEFQRVWGFGALVGGAAVIAVAFIVVLFRKPARRAVIVDTDSAAHAVDPTIAKASEETALNVAEEMQGTCFERTDDVTPRQPLRMIGRLLSWAVLIAIFGLAGWWVYEHRSEFAEKSTAVNGPVPVPGPKG